MSDNEDMKNVLLLLIPLICLETMAGDLDKNQTEGLIQAKESMKNPEKRAAAIKGDKSARKADAVATITVMGNKDYKEEMYAISAEILDWVVRQEQPQKLMQRYQADPVAFLKEMPPEQAAKIKALADQIEQKRKSNRVPASVAQP